MHVFAGSYLSASLLFLTACSPLVEYEVIIRNGTLYDGSGSAEIIRSMLLNSLWLGRPTGRMSSFSIFRSSFSLAARPAERYVTNQSRGV